jgi:hypothetical protein
MKSSVDLYSVLVANNRINLSGSNPDVTKIRKVKITNSINEKGRNKERIFR